MKKKAEGGDRNPFEHFAEEMKALIPEEAAIEGLKQVTDHWMLSFRHLVVLADRFDESGMKAVATELRDALVLANLQYLYLTREKPS